ESQMDRFLLRIRLGYPGRGEESQILRERGAGDPVSAIEPVIDHRTLLGLQDSVESVAVSDALVDYAMNVIEETRRAPSLAVGVSTRGALNWYRAAQAHALASGRQFCVPDDFKGLAAPALAHRVVLSAPTESLGRAREEAERIISDLLARVPVPT
ncbi:MAG TPA: MoxR family ATPase, partial [Kofleriaceae bacterium]|nr:MoxR family ATPase [Kofleriaceae bacterium]